MPHLHDGLKPVQRRILHSMKRMDDGRYNKVANIIGNTMQFHPHGDASIGDALVQLGQKELLIDCQGNWGNIYTGDRAAAPRYIEARLSKFALDVVITSYSIHYTKLYDEKGMSLKMKKVRKGHSISTRGSSKAYFNEDFRIILLDKGGSKIMDIQKFNSSAKAGNSIQELARLLDMKY